MSTRSGDSTYKHMLFPNSLLERVDLWCRREGYATEAEAIRSLVRIGLDAVEKKSKGKVVGLAN